MQHLTGRFDFSIELLSQLKYQVFAVRAGKRHGYR